MVWMKARSNGGLEGNGTELVLGDFIGYWRHRSMEHNQTQH